jgi:hypothetical protein
MGAYEFQGPGVAQFIGWLHDYGLPTDGSADHVDTDGDGMDNWQEWIADTSPIDVTSALRLLAPSADPPSITVTWQSTSNRTYSLERSTNYSNQVIFSAIASNIPGRFSMTSFTDTNATAPGAAVYRVGVQGP